MAVSILQPDLRDLEARFNVGFLDGKCPISLSHALVSFSVDPYDQISA